MFRSSKLTNSEITKNSYSEDFVFSYYYQFGKLPSNKRISLGIYDVLTFENTSRMQCQHVFDYLNKEVGNDPINLLRELRDSAIDLSKHYSPSAVVFNLLFFCVNAKHSYHVFYNAFDLVCKKLKISKKKPESEMTCSFFCSVNYFYREDKDFQSMPLVEHSMISLLRIGDHLKSCTHEIKKTFYNKDMIKDRDLYIKPIDIDNNYLDSLFKTNLEQGPFPVVIAETAYTLLIRISTYLCPEKKTPDQNCEFLAIDENDTEVKKVFLNSFLKKADEVFGPNIIAVGKHDEAACYFGSFHPLFINIQSIEDLSFSIPYYLIKNMDRIRLDFLNQLLVWICFLHAACKVLSNNDFDFTHRCNFLRGMRPVFYDIVNYIHNTNVFYCTLGIKDQKIKEAYKQYVSLLYDVLTPQDKESYSAMNTICRDILYSKRMASDLSFARLISVGDVDSINYKRIDSIVYNLEIR
jgi:hypothetical protein